MFKATRVRVFVIRRWMIMMFLVMLVMTGIIRMMDVQLRPSIAMAARAIALRTATEALNGAVTEQLAEDAEASRIVHIVRDKQGELQTAEFDFASVTRLQTAATARAEKQLHNLGEETLYLPVMQALGGSWFAAFGPRLPVHVVMLGTAHSSVVADVKSVGINQTVHILYLDLTADVRVVAPLVAQPATVHVRVPVAYVVFAGEVPKTYMSPGLYPFPALSHGS